MKDFFRVETFSGYSGSKYLYSELSVLNSFLPIHKFYSQ